MQNFLFMEALIKKEELQSVTANFPLISEQLNDLLMSVLRLNKVNEVYKNCYNDDTLNFIESVLNQLKVNIKIDEKELNNIPEDGAFITVSNHPYGGLDGLILLLLVLKKRSDYKAMANYLLKRIEPLSDKILAVNPFEDIKQSSYNASKSRASNRYISCR